MRPRIGYILSAILLVGAVPGSVCAADPLAEAFIDPPVSARPRVWWHWLDGNISQDGIAKDLAWMKSVGIGGLQSFDANVPTKQIVEQRLVYMSPEWKDAFRFAATEAERLELELAIASSPGWSQTGGPWVKPEDALKKLVWAETVVPGGRHFRGRLSMPAAITGPFQSLRMVPSVHEMMWPEGAIKHKEPPSHYGDVAVLAVPLGLQADGEPKVSLADGSPLPAAELFDDDLETGVTLARGSPKTPTAVVLSYGRTQTIRSATVFVAGGKLMFMAPMLLSVLEASDDGAHWRQVADIHADQVPTTVSFAPATARYFRLVLKPLPMGMIDLGTPAPGAEFPASAAGAAKAMSAPWRLQHFKLSAEAKVDHVETKAGFSLVDDYYALPERADGAVGIDPRKVIDLTSRMKPDGTLDWTPPPGRWRVIRFGYSLLGTTNNPATPEATGLEVDKFDAAAVRRYLEHYIGMYRDAVGSEFLGRRGIRAILNDSIEVGAANWTPQMIEQFKRLRGYDPVPWFPTLTGVLIGDRQQSDKFLYDYRRTLADLMASEHYGTVAKVAHENGLKVYGEALETRRPSLGDDMAMRSHADVPMAAMWTFDRTRGPNPSYVADVRGAASVAHIYGQNLVAAESMTSALNYWNDSPATLKRIIDLAFVHGVNLPVVHTSVHQPRDDKSPGLSLLMFGQFFNRHESWGEMARPWVDYIARNSLMLQQGRNVADVAYFYGEEAPLTGLYGKKHVSNVPQVHAYDFVNADVLMSALTNDGGDLVTPGGARYRALYLGGSSQKMTLAALRRLAELVDRGATVVGLAPEGNPGLAGEAQEYAALIAKLWPGGELAQVGKGRVIASRDIEAALRQIGVAPQFRFAGAPDADIPFVHRELGDGESYFLVNRKDRPEVIEARFRVAGKAPELWHADSGKSEPLSYRIVNGETVIPLTLAAEASVHVVFRKPATADSLVTKAATPGLIASIEGPWIVHFQPGRGAPAMTNLPNLMPLNEAADSGIKYFSGVATYSRDFRAPKAWKSGEPLWLDLGEVREIAEVHVNGKPVGIAWHAPYRIDIGAATQKGRNSLEIRVANLWANRLIGDAQPGASKVAFTAMPTYRASAPLRRSGLIGPVQLLIEIR